MLELKIERIDAEPAEFLIAETDTRESSDQINAAADVICNEYAKRTRQKMKLAERYDWLQPLCYRLFEHCHQNGLGKHLKRRSEKSRRYKTGSHDDITVFQKYLMGVFATEKDAFDEKDRNRVGLSLWYAYRHFIPWFMLNGFLFQYGKGLRSESINNIEPEFDDWIVVHATRDLSFLKKRGEYSQSITKKVSTSSATFAHAFGVIKGLHR